MEACRSHAQDLFEGAKLLRERSLPNLSYHLATLVLEELGKGQLIGMKSFAKDDADSWYGKQFDDHIKKLFWALWGQFLAKPPDTEEIERLKGTASIIHNNRMRGLYVEAVAENFVAPKDAITDEMLAPLMTLVEAKLALQPSLQGVEYTQEDLDLLNWFSNVTDVPEKRNFIFSKTSFDKMAELGAKEWLRWVRDEIERSSAAAIASLQKEMARGLTEGEEGQEEKWELKLRFFSQSHSIRPKSLNRWNQKVNWVKLYPVRHLDWFVSTIDRLAIHPRTLGRTACARLERRGPDYAGQRHNARSADGARSQSHSQRSSRHGDRRFPVHLYRRLFRSPCHGSSRALDSRLAHGTKKHTSSKSACNRDVRSRYLAPAWVLPTG